MPADEEIFDSLQDNFQKREWTFKAITTKEGTQIREPARVTITKYTNGNNPQYNLSINGNHCVKTDDPTGILEYLYKYFPDVKGFLAKPTE